jgi:hypothetical protein
LVNRTRSTVLTLAALPVIALLAACGSDSSTGPHSTPAVDTVAVDYSTYQQLEYYVNHGSDSSYSSWQNSYGYQYVDMYNGGNYAYEDRAIFGFSLPTLAGRGAVDSAKTYVYQCASPSLTLGSVILDHVHFGADLNDSAAFSGDLLQANVGTVTSDPATSLRAVTVTSSVQADYAAKRGSSQYRMEFVLTTPPLAASNGVGVDFGEDACNGGTLPFLVIWSH